MRWHGRTGRGGWTREGRKEGRKEGRDAREAIRSAAAGPLVVLSSPPPLPCVWWVGGEWKEPGHSCACGCVWCVRVPLFDFPPPPGPARPNKKASGASSPHPPQPARHKDKVVVIPPSQASSVASSGCGAGERGRVSSCDGEGCGKPASNQRCPLAKWTQCPSYTLEKGGGDTRQKCALPLWRPRIISQAHHGTSPLANGGIQSAKQACPHASFLSHPSTNPPIHPFIHRPHPRPPPPPPAAAPWRRTPGQGGLSSSSCRPSSSSKTQQPSFIYGPPTTTPPPIIPWCGTAATEKGAGTLTPPTTAAWRHLPPPRTCWPAFSRSVHLHSTPPTHPPTHSTPLHPPHPLHPPTHPPHSKTQGAQQRRASSGEGGDWALSSSALRGGMVLVANPAVFLNKPPADLAARFFLPTDLSLELMDSLGGTYVSLPTHPPTSLFTHPPTHSPFPRRLPTRHRQNLANVLPIVLLPPTHPPTHLPPSRRLPTRHRQNLANVLPIVLLPPTHPPTHLPPSRRLPTRHRQPR